MSRSGYSDDYCADWDNALALYRQAVDRSIAGKRGQKLLRDLVGALDAMPEKKLVVGLFHDSGDVCALGALGRSRGLDMSELDRRAKEAADDEWLAENVREAAAEAFDVAPSLAAEVMYLNDDDRGPMYGPTETPEHRWHRMRRWVESQIREGT